MSKTGPWPIVLARHAVEILSVLACVTLVTIVAAAAWLSYRQHSETERNFQLHHAGDMALVLEGYARGTLSSVDDAVRRIKLNYERDGMRTDLLRVLEDYRDIAGYIAVASVADEQGRLILSSLPIPPGAVIADLAHFRAHVERDTGEPYINRPVLGRVSGKWSFHVTRRINRADGSFGGVAIVAVDFSYWSRLLQNGSIGNSAVIALVGRDGAARAVHGRDGAAEELMTADWSFLLRRVAAGEERGFAAGGEGAAGRMTGNWAYRSLAGYPLIVAVSVDEDALQRQLGVIRAAYAWGVSAVALFAILFTAGLLLLLARQRAHAAESLRSAGALQQSEARLRTIADHVSEGLALFDREDRLVFFNEPYRRMLSDATPEVSLGRTFESLVRDRANFLSRTGVINDVESFVAGRMKRHRELPGGAMERMRADGSCHQVREGQTADGQTVLSFVDITGLKKREAELQESEGRFRAMFDHAGIGITVRSAHDRHLPWLVVNDKFCEMTGYSREELLHMSTQQVTTPEGNAEADRNNTRIVRGEISSYSREKRIRRKDGSWMWVAVVVAALPDARGRPHRVIATYQDINARKLAEDRLRESEGRFKAMFDHAGVGITLRPAHDGNQHWVEVNDKFCEMTGYSRGEALLMSMADITAPERITGALRDEKRLIGGEIRSYAVEKRIRRKDGSWMWIALSVASLPDADGNPHMIIATYQDINARKLTEVRLHAIIAAEPECVAIVAPDGELLDMNPAGLRMLEADSLEEMRRWPFLKQVGPRYRRAFVRLQRRILAGGSGMLEFEASGVRGKHCWLEIHGAPLRDASGEITAMLGIARDVTERRTAREALAAERNLLRTVIDNLPDRIRVKGRDLRYILANTAWMKVRAPAHRDVTGLSNRDLLQREGAAAADAEDRAVLATGQPSRPREVIDGPPGNPHWYVTTKTPLRDATGGVIGVVAISRDVTDFKQRSLEVEKLNAALEIRVAERTAQLTATNEELEAFASSVSHDLRAPLRHIDGLAAALLEDYAEKLDAPAQGYLTRIRAAAVRMANLIEDLLRLSRVTRAELRIADTDLSAIALGIAEELQREYPQRVVNFRIEAGLRAPADPGMLHSALANLIHNAWKFTGNKPVAAIEFGRMQRDGMTVYFVRDDGAGFDMAQAGRLFNAFQRLHAEHEFSGTGIGLATVRRVMRRHGGDAWAESAPGQGATFFFTLGARPGVPAAVRQDLSADTRPAVPSAPGGQPAVLLVDDDPDVLTLSARALAPDGHQVLTAERGEAALAMMREHGVSVVVSDFSMPGMNGAQLLAQVATLYPHTLRIIVSGQTMNRAMQAGLRKGEIHHYFEKQHSYDAVRKCIRDWLATARRPDK